MYILLLFFGFQFNDSHKINLVDSINKILLSETEICRIIFYGKLYFGILRFKIMSNFLILLSQFALDLFSLFFKLLLRMFNAKKLLRVT